MTNMRVVVMNAPTLKLCTHASKIEVSIYDYDVLDVLVDDDFIVNAMSQDY